MSASATLGGHKNRKSRMTKTATQNAIVTHTNSYCHYYKMTVTNIIIMAKHIENDRSRPGNPNVRAARLCILQNRLLLLSQ